MYHGHAHRHTGVCMTTCSLGVVDICYAIHPTYRARVCKVPWHSIVTLQRRWGLVFTLLVLLAAIVPITVITQTWKNIIAVR